MKTVLSVLAVVLLALVWSQAEAQICGDANGDEGYNIGDAVFLSNYLFKGEPEPPSYTYADADGYRVLTVNDMIVMMTHRTAVCPPGEKKFSGPTNSGYSVSLNNTTWPAGNASQNIQIMINTATSFIYTELPLLIHVGNELPQVITCTTDPDLTAWSDIGPGCNSFGDGEVLLSFADTAYVPTGPYTTESYPDGKTLVTLQLSLPSAPTQDQDITLSWDADCPPINATYGPSHYPVIVVDWNKSHPNVWKPALPGQKVPSLTVWGAAALVALLLAVGIWLFLRKKRIPVTS